MPRPCRAVIHTAALRHNLRRVRSSMPDARVMAVVKANAYGHGIAHVYEGLRAADGFALLDLAEAQLLRDLGWRGPILLLEGAFEARDLEVCSRLGLWHVVHCDAQMDWLAAHKTQVAHRVFLKFNGGMNRLGFSLSRYRAAWARLNALPQVEEISHMMHFSDADGDASRIAHSVQAFAHATQDLPGARCVANSAAILRHGASLSGMGDWVRAGIALYGSAPDHPLRTAADWALQPAMSLRSQIMAVQHLQQGATVGYGSLFQAGHSMRVGVVACGYADGYPRVCPTGTPMLVHGQRTRSIGRVSMDMLAVDVTNMPEAHIGSEVTLWGQSGNGAVLPIDEVAQCAGTLGYELMCALAPRVTVHVQT